MKVDRGRPAHWLWLARFTVNVAIATILRWLTPRKRRNTVILYGHKFNGNLRALYEYARRQAGAPRLQFLTMDPEYHRVLQSEGLPSLLGTQLRHVLALRDAYALISDHGLHALSLMLRRTDLKFVDVWHGVPFKGFNASDFRLQRRFDEVWVASPMLRDLYISRFGFRPAIVHATGYARTDRLVPSDVGMTLARRALDLPEAKKVVLFAPTWQQDDRRRDIVPFGLDADQFLDRINSFCASHDAICVVRRHLNTKGDEQQRYSHVLFRPHEQYPDSEEVLMATNVLICDWSSIAFDFLLLERPTIFLDVPAPFRNGFSLDARYRFGPIVSDAISLFALLERCITDPESYREAHLATHRQVAEAVYQGSADGHASERCFQRLLALRAP